MAEVVTILTTHNSLSLCLSLCLLSPCPAYAPHCACNTQREKKSYALLSTERFPQWNWHRHNVANTSDKTLVCLERQDQVSILWTAVVLGLGLKGGWKHSTIKNKQTKQPNTLKCSFAVKCEHPWPQQEAKGSDSPLL